MKLKLVNGAFIAETAYEERAIPKAAGFWWHAGKDCKSYCVGCKHNVPAKKWYTTEPTKAVRLIAHADEATRASLQPFQDNLEASRATDRTDVDLPCPEGLAYLPFQKAGIAYCLDKGSALLSDEMGLGKSVQSLGVINSDPSVGSVLVLCPASLRINWLREAQKWLVRKFSFYVAQNSDPIPASANFVIVNYDKLLDQKVFDALMARSWDMLIADECHKLKNPKAQRTQKVLGYYDKTAKAKVPGLVDRARRRLMLTGTPVLNRPIELHPILSAIDYKTWGNFWAYAKRFCGAYQGKYGWDLTGATNLEELQTKLRATIMIRRLKKDVLKELPAIRRQVICLPRNGASALVDEEENIWSGNAQQLQDMQDAVELAAASGDEAAYKAAVRALTEAARVRFEEIARVRHAIAVAKVPQVIEHLETVLESEPKVIVFAHHHDVVRPLAEHFGDAAVTLTGETPMGIRQDLVDRFQNDPAVKVFIASISAAGVGLTLTAASVVVFAELDWVPANISQAESRAHRIGQQNSVLVQHLVVDGSLDASMAHTLVAKQDIADTALDTEPVLPQPEKAKRRSHPQGYPVATAEQRAACALALQILSGMCDGAREEDGVGFNKCDTNIGKKLAAVSMTRDLTDGEVWLAAKIVIKYKRQYGEELAAQVRGSAKAEANEE